MKIPHGVKHTILRPAFWIGQAIGITVSFPFEHYLWEHIWPFAYITKHWLGL